MKIVGFSIEEIIARKSTDIPKAAISTDILFTDIDKAKLEVFKDSEGLQVKFKFSIQYKDPVNKTDTKNEINFVGSIIITVSKEESKEFIKLWKSKQVPKDKMLPLYNFILRRCSVRALQLEEELNLQPHIPFPQIRPGQQQTK